MKFCEQCGTKLTPGTRFCEECGTEVDTEEVAVAASKDVASITERLKDIFCTLGWKSEWERAASDAVGNELGLILTREDELLRQIDADSVAFRTLIANYIDKAAERGVKYYYLNLNKFPDYEGNGSVASVVEALRCVVDVARPKYLMILGNEEVIDVAVWKNPAYDPDGDVDKNVESDLCYMTLDKESPWEGQEYNFDEAIRVGRLPTYSGEDFRKFKAYFDSAIQNIGQMDRQVPYGLSALVWQDESNDEFGKTTSRKVDVSPQVVYSNVSVRMGVETNLLFFNLHGNSHTEYWYGQEGKLFPEAFSPSVLAGIDRPYFLGVEACYGARYIDGLTPENSILLTAMQNKCIAFLGSSKIAFGKKSPPGSCADLVIGSYIKSVSNGESAGDAHVIGLKRLSSDWNSMDDADIKTMAEFSLYGDPSARKGANATKNGLKRIVSSSKVRKGLSVPMPDIRRAIHFVITEVDAKIEAIVDDYVRREVLPELSDAIGSKAVETTVIKMTKNGLNQKVYSLKLGVINKVAKVYFDDEGHVRKALVSK